MQFPMHSHGVKMVKDKYQQMPLVEGVLYTAHNG